MLQYRGELLPLKDQGNVLPDLDAMRQRGEEVLATVLICGDASLGENKGRHGGAGKCWMFLRERCWSVML